MYKRFTLNDLPKPATGKTGWPWDKEPDHWPDHMQDGRQWPKITIVTPSYNQGLFLEETIRSVLCQGYPELDYIIIDGGSNDNSVEIIRKYEKWLYYWESEKDKGQGHAINKGWSRARPGIWAFLNSDDTYLPGTLQKAAIHLSGLPEARLVYASVLHTDKDGNPLHYYRGIPLVKGLRRMEFWKGWHIPQASVFLNSDLFEKYGGLKEDFHLGLDYEWFIRLSGFEKFECIDDIWATAKIHPEAKTGDWETNKKYFYIENNKANKLNSKVYEYFWLCLKYFFYEKLLLNQIVTRIDLERRLKKVDRLFNKTFQTSQIIENYVLGQEILFDPKAECLDINYKGHIKRVKYFHSLNSEVVDLPIVFKEKPCQDYISVSISFEPEPILSNRIKKLKLILNDKYIKTVRSKGEGFIQEKAFFHLSQLTKDNRMLVRLKIPGKKSRIHSAPFQVLMSLKQMVLK